ncbi:MAG: PKD domain-containing protein [Candidatus Bathyarchaeota archaeon]|nr:MAG: PKD domain-containing protein [Candidatus Bathyarchaeota archaeon]
MGVVEASPDAAISMVPSDIEKNPGESFSIDVTVVNAEDVYSWGIKIGWEGPILEATSVTEGPFLKGQPDGSAFVKKIYDDYIDIGCATLGNWPGRSGNGTLMTVAFNVTGNGATELDIYYSVLLNSASPPVEMPHTVEDGSFRTTMPVASFTWSPDSYGRPIVGEPVTLNASASYDPDGGSIVSYDWDFGDDATGTGMIPTHTYSEASDYIVTLNVTDDEGETDTYTLDPEDIYNPPLSVKRHDLAVVNVEATPQSVLVNETIEVFVTVMNNGSHPTGVPVVEEAELFNITLYYFDYSWHFISTYDRMLRCNPGENQTTGVGTIYPDPFIWNTSDVEPGSYTLWAYAYLMDPTVNFLPGLEENTANNAKASTPVSVAETAEHDVAVTAADVNPTMVEVEEMVEIDVRVENEGTFSESFSVNVYNGTSLITTQNTTLTAGAGRTLSFSWFEAANTTAKTTYSIYVEVPPVVNETDVADNTFTGVPGTIQLLPVAYFTFSPSKPTPDRTVTFDGSASYAPGIPAKTIDSYSWDFGDGTNGTGAAVTHAYNTTGTYSVTLTIVDSDGLSNSHSISLIVYEAHEATRTISITLSDIKIVQGEGITINGSVASTLPGLTVTVWFRAFAETWDTLAIVITDGDGNYAYDWTPWSRGTYEVKASWQVDGALEVDESVVEVLVVQGAAPVSLFLYSTVALAALLVATIAYFMWIRKPKPA